MGGAVLELGGRKFSLSRDEMKALGALRAALQSRGAGLQDAALDAARRTATGRDARYVLALYELALGNQRNDESMRAAALDALIASDLTPSKNLAGNLAQRGGIAYRAGEFSLADALWGRLLGLTPDDPDVASNLAQVRLARGDAAGALDLLERSIAQRAATGTRAPETLYRQRLAIASQAGLAGPGVAAARALVHAWPSPANWRSALHVHRQLAAPQGALEIDWFRLLRTVGGLSKPEEYQRFAQLLEHAGQGAEAKAVLGEALRQGLLDVSVSPVREIAAETERAIVAERGRLAKAPISGMAAAESLAGNGRLDEAVMLYRTLVAGTGADTAQANARLGAALLRAGKRADAEAAFRRAADDGVAGPLGYPALARFWLEWLARSGR